MLLMLPNVGWILLPESDGGQQGSAPLALTIAENLGRAAVMGLPFFYSLDLKMKYSTVVMAGMGLALAVAPVVLLILSSYMMNSWLMFGASLYFGAAHVGVLAMTR